MNPEQIVKCFSAVYFYLREEDPDVILNTVYKNPHPSYLEEKKAIFLKDRVLWFLTSLDTVNQGTILRKAVEKELGNHNKINI